MIYYKRLCKETIMIRTNKVKIMTRAAIFEKKEENRALYVSRFFQNDYIIYGMLKSAISLTFAFAFGACMWVIYHAEELMTEKSVSDLFALGKELVGWYLAGFGYLFIDFLVVYWVRYHDARKRLKDYRSNLRKLLKTYQEETTAKERSL